MSRRLAPDEAELWHRVARTVVPMRGKVPPRNGEGDHAVVEEHRPVAQPGKVKTPVPLHQPAAGPPPRSGEERPRPLDRHGLDGTWERKLAQGTVSPDFTLDLHGHTLETAHTRLDHGLAQALAHGARVVLLITGRPRAGSDHADRSQRRGAIRAKFLDWLAHGSHASKIASVRGAHPRHGGAGAVYIVLKRGR